jgi:hypothetical protein
MRFFLGLLMAGGTLVGPVAHAQEMSAVPAADTSRPTAAIAAPAAPATAGQLDDVQRMLAVMYADIERLKAHENATFSRVLTVGSGAGAGYLVGGLIAGALAAPVAAGVVTTVGMGEMVSAGAAGAVETMGAFSGAYGGALAADGLLD